jgi:hypothetical protein
MYLCIVCIYVYHSHPYLNTYLQKDLLTKLSEAVERHQRKFFETRVTATFEGHFMTGSDFDVTTS